jgi:hypothetical protein
MFNSDLATILFFTVGIPIIMSISAWVAVQISVNRSKARTEADKHLAEALHQSSEVNVRLLEKLTEIDGRLKSVEKTLSDIPS